VFEVSLYRNGWFAPATVEKCDGGGDTLPRRAQRIDEGGEGGWCVLAGERSDIVLAPTGRVA
jgi:hypothetical protein